MVSMPPRVRPDGGSSARQNLSRRVRESTRSTASANDLTRWDEMNPVHIVPISRDFSRQWQASAADEPSVWMIVIFLSDTRDGYRCLDGQCARELPHCNLNRVKEEDDASDGRYNSE